jgi:hypothetical protein
MMANNHLILDFTCISTIHEVKSYYYTGLFSTIMKCKRLVRTSLSTGKTQYGLVFSGPVAVALILVQKRLVAVMVALLVGFILIYRSPKIIQK